MKNQEPLHNEKLPTPNWNTVRSIYKKLSDEFHILTGPYNIHLDSRTKFMLDHLIIAIDQLDDFIDKLPEEKDRNEITESLILYLKNPDIKWNHPLANDLLRERMMIIKQIVHELDIMDRFVSAAEKIFRYTELKRHTLKQEELLDFVTAEGEATAELPLSFMGIASDHPFGNFFANLCKLMGIADLVVDAQADYKANYIALKPNLRLYAKLNFIMVKEGLRLFWYFPKKIQFLLYCIRFTWLLITAKD